MRRYVEASSSHYRTRKRKFEDELACSCRYHDYDCQYHNPHLTQPCDCTYHKSIDESETGSVNLNNTTVETCDNDLAIEESSFTRDSCEHFDSSIKGSVSKLVQYNYNSDGSDSNSEYFTTSAVSACDSYRPKSPQNYDESDESNKTIENNTNEESDSNSEYCTSSASNSPRNLSECVHQLDPNNESKVYNNYTEDSASRLQSLSSSSAAVCDGDNAKSIHNQDHQSDFSNEVLENASDSQSSGFNIGCSRSKTSSKEKNTILTKCNSLASIATSEVTSDEDDIFNCDFVAYHLNEDNEDAHDEDRNEYNSPTDSSEEEDEEEEEIGHNDSDPDDPPDQDPDPDPEPDPAPAVDPLGNRPYFSLDNPRLDRILELGFECTVREAVVMIAAIAVRYNMEYDLIVKMLRLSNIMLGEAQLPSTKDQLWSYLNRRLQVTTRHAYCSVRACRRSLGLYNELPRVVECLCGAVKPRKKIKYFITLSISQQVKRCLEQPGVWQKLQYRHERRIITEGATEDIFDGDAYIQLTMMHDGLREPYDFTYNFNLDGFRMTKSSNKQATPIFIRLNEAPANLRQQFVFLAGLWVDDDCPPILNLFMDRFITESNSLSTIGLAWTPPGGVEVVSKLFPACCCVDAVERASVMCHNSHSGPYACPFCTLEGVHINARKFPLPGTEFDIVRRRQNQDFIQHIVVQGGQLRTDASARQAMEEIEEAREGGIVLQIEGVIGTSPLKNLRFFNLVDSLTSDDLHPIYLGVAAFHMRLILRRLTPHQITAINARLLAIKCPTNISRKPRKISKKKNLKGSEWEHILLYFGVPCMQGIVENAKITHFGLLSTAVHILSRDSITEQNFVTADRLIRLYMIRFQNTYGPSNMRFNVHILSHLVSVCRKWGPLFAHSTYPFESYNCILGKKVTSPKAAADQIVQRYFLKALILEVPAAENINERVKEEVEYIMQKDTTRPTLVLGDCKFYGRARERATTLEEMQALRDEGIEGVLQLQEYVKMKYNYFEFRSVNYNPDEDIRSDNSYIFTFDNYFGRILSIVVIREGNNRICGFFVERFNVGERLSGVHHIIELLDRADIHFVSANEVRNMAIRINIGNVSYIMAMANQCEID